jgi:hypothetical protein
MKRLLSTFALAALMMAACNQAGTTATKADSVSAIAAKALAPPPNSDIVRETLDGIPEKDALQMIANFKPDAETNTITTFFIKKDMLMLLNDMLAKEIAAPLPGGRHYRTDGIRIYFGKETPTSPDIRLIVVATTDSIKFIPPPPSLPSNEKMHHDYYDHLQALLHSSTVPLKITTEPQDMNKAVLYKVCGDCDREPSCDGVKKPGAIARSYAESMVQNFKGKIISTNAVWFDADRLKRIAEGSSFAGLRIYMATYPDATYNANGLSTLVLTTVDATGKDYFYCESETIPFIKGGKRILKYRPLWGPGENNGSLCPNNCN